MIVRVDAILKREMSPKRGEWLVSRREAIDICQLDERALQILQSTTFGSQAEYNFRRGLRISNTINDFLAAEHFQGKTILELGPGHYAFALLARHLGARVICVEREPAFAEMGRHLGFEVVEMNFNDVTPEILGRQFDGLWVKGTFNACGYQNDEAVGHFVSRLTSFVGTGGWAWCVTVNKAQDPVGEARGTEFPEHRIEVQRASFEQHAWDVTPIDDSDRKRYALNYTGGRYYFTRNLAFEAVQSAVRGPHKHDGIGHLREAPSGKPFNKVSTIWKPTLEYYPDPWQYYVEFIDILKAKGAKFLTMREALARSYSDEEINILLDHHVDFYPVETEVMCRWELAHGVIANVYLFNRFERHKDRLQRKPWRIEDLNVCFYQELEKRGFEIGYHQNAVGLARGSDTERTYGRELDPAIVEKAKGIFAEDVANLARYFNIRTFIPHGDGEANNQLLDLPAGVEHLIWVYNNSRMNKTRRPPVQWQNYSDSCGCSTQRMSSAGALYLVNIDNLHIRAHLAASGLHHILIHPGRFSKGMPYELYESPDTVPEEPLIRMEFENIKEDDLPLRVPALIARWEDPTGARQRSSHWTERSDSYPIPALRAKYYVLSDDVEVLRNHMAANESAVPFLLVHRRITPEEKERYKVRRPASAVIPIPVAPEAACHADQAQINRLFREQFAKFYNIVFSPDALKHLCECPLVYHALYLTELAIRSRREFSVLLDLLERYRGRDQVVLRARIFCVLNVDPRNVYRGHPKKAELVRAYSTEVAEVPKEDRETSGAFVLGIRSRALCH